MNISIKSTNIELTPALRDYTEKRMGGITKFTGGDANVSIEIGKTTAHHKNGEVFLASVDVITPLGKMHHAASEKSDLYEAIDDVRSEIVREISKDKGRRETLFKRGAKKVKDMLRGFRS